MNIVQLFIDKVAASPNQVALVEGQKKLSYRQLNEQVIHTVFQFRKDGIKAGDRVMVVVPVSIDTYRIVLALWHIGATAVFLEEWAFRNNFHLNKNILACQAVVLSQKIKWLTFFRSDFKSIPIQLSCKIPKSQPGYLPDLNQNPASAIISLTSGSSGQPKIADRSHAFLKAQFKALTRIDSTSGNETVLVGLPVVVFFYLGKGCCVVLRHKKALKKKHLSTILKQNLVSHIIDSPAHLLRYQSYFNNRQAEQILKILTGGGPVFNSDIEILSERFSNAVLKIVYGSTEVEPVSVSRISLDNIPNKKENTALNVGEVDPEIGLRIGDFSRLNKRAVTLEDFENCLLDNEEIGEIVVSGPHVLDTYFNDNSGGMANRKFEVGETIWHPMGDSGFIKNNQLFLTGPLQQLIRHNAHIISPFIVESYLKTVPGIENGTVLLIKNKLWLIIQSKKLKEMDSDTLDLRFKIDQVKILKKIPMDARHQTKIDYKKLKNKILSNGV